MSPEELPGDLRTLSEGSEPPSGPQDMRVSEAMCEAMRASGATHSELAEEHGVSESVVWYHIAGECSHERGWVDERRCNLLRVLAGEGVPAGEIASEHSPVNRTQTSRHIYGHCGCDSDEEPLSAETPPHVDEETCRRMRAAYEDVGSYSGVADLPWVPCTRAPVRYHVEGECSHG